MYVYMIDVNTMLLFNTVPKAMYMNNVNLIKTNLVSINEISLPYKITHFHQYTFSCNQYLKKKTLKYEIYYLIGICGLAAIFR